MTCTVSPIHTETEYRAALERLSAIMRDPEAADEIEVLAILIEAYEAERYPMPEATPLEILTFHMQQNDLRPKDLAPLVGGSGRASEVLSGTRELSKSMIRAISAAWKIPPACLI